jgi:hypothetical protein
MRSEADDDDNATVKDDELEVVPTGPAVLPDVDDPGAAATVEVLF